MSKVILSTEYPQFAEQLQLLGYEIIPSEEIPCQMAYERRHADLQCLLLKDTAFVLKHCQRLIRALSDSLTVIPCGDNFGGKYPDNIILNAANIGKNLICRVASLDDKVRDYCDRHDIELIDVRQGYAKCSCAAVGNHAIITADRGISRALGKTEIDVLTIGEGSVTLSGADHGFIGGASGYDSAKRTLYVSGNIDRHPDGERMKRFCAQYGVSIYSLSDEVLTDIGGMIFC